MGNMILGITDCLPLNVAYFPEAAVRTMQNIFRSRILISRVVIPLAEMLAARETPETILLEAHTGKREPNPWLFKP
jgi:hypothetical protein